MSLKIEHNLGRWHISGDGLTLVARCQTVHEDAARWAAYAPKESVARMVDLLAHELRFRPYSYPVAALRELEELHAALRETLGVSKQ